MNIKTQVTVVALVLLAMVLLINRIRKNKLELKYALSWIFLGAGILIFDLFPGLTSFLASLLGIEVPINMLFFLGFCFSLLIIFSLTVAVSRLSRRVTKLTQELALLSKKLEDSQNTANKTN